MKEMLPGRQCHLSSAVPARGGDADHQARFTRTASAVPSLNQSPSRARRASLGDAVSRRLWLLDSGNLCAAARRRTGLKDFGDPPIEPALSVLARSLEREAGLHPLGRFLMRMHLLGLLETRLRLTDLWHRQADAVALTPVYRPVFITGMPRSGSTFLHELLGEDPASRVPRVWEVMFPVPGPIPATGADPRIRKAAACLWCFRRLAPEADAVFPMRAMTPHECVAIHSYSFLSEEFISTCRIPGYEAFLRASNLQPAYEFQRRFLQHLQAGAPTHRWVSKSPDHVYGLEPLFAVFPDALVIQTHRNPLEAVKSSCRLTEVLHRLYARPDEREQLVSRELRILADAMDRLIRFRDAHPELVDRFVDVKYPDLVTDPLAVIREIYRRFNLPLTDAAIERMKHLASSRARYRKGRSADKQIEFRLETSPEASRFEGYCARFKLALQRPRLR